jgi:hypothetical protein
MGSSTSKYMEPFINTLSKKFQENKEYCSFLEKGVEYLESTKKLSKIPVDLRCTTILIWIWNMSESDKTIIMNMPIDSFAYTTVYNKIKDYALMITGTVSAAATYAAKQIIMPKIDILAKIIALGEQEPIKIPINEPINEPINGSDEIPNVLFAGVLCMPLIDIILIIIIFILLYYIVVKLDYVRPITKKESMISYRPLIT